MATRYIVPREDGEGGLGRESKRWGDENGDLMPMIAPITSEIFMLDENGDITYQ